MVDEGEAAVGAASPEATVGPADAAAEAPIASTDHMEAPREKSRTRVSRHPAAHEPSPVRLSVRLPLRPTRQAWARMAAAGRKFSSQGNTFQQDRGLPGYAVTSGRCAFPHPPRPFFLPRLHNRARQHTH